MQYLVLLGLLIGAFFLVSWLSLYATAIGAIAMYVAWLRYEQKVKELPPVTSPGSFLDPAEFQQVENLKRSANLFDTRRTNIQTEIQNIRAAGAGLAIRQDGAFYETSKLGKQLNLKISALQSESATLNSHLLQVSSQMATMNMAPQKRWQKWAEVTALRDSLRLTIIVHNAAFITILLTMSSGSLRDFSRWAKKHVSGASSTNNYAELAFILAGLVAFAAIIPAKRYILSQLKAAFPPPP